MIRKEKRKFDIHFLNEILLRDKAILQGEYYKINREININFICSCGKEHIKNFRMMVDHCGALCEKCTEKHKREKTEGTLFKKYGNKNIFQIEEIKEKSKETCMKNYNVENPSQAKIIKGKKIETCMKNYKVENPSQAKIVKEKKIETCMKNTGFENPSQCSKIKEKMKQTNIRIRGVEHPLQCPKVKEKMNETRMKIYGVTTLLKNKVIMKKSKETNLKNRGVQYPTQCPKVREKIKQTNLRVRGVEHPSQCVFVQKKKEESRLTFKEYVCPSGKVIKIQGYEYVALNDLFRSFSENQIVTERSEIPVIPYVYEENKHYYFPDIFIPHLNKIIEVKSTWTYSLEVDKIKAKEKATKEKGYDYEYWVCDSNRVLFITKDHIF
jgi:hypothetical protein